MIFHMSYESMVKQRYGCTRGVRKMAWISDTQKGRTLEHYHWKELKKHNEMVDAVGIDVCLYTQG